MTDSASNASIVWRETLDEVEPADLEGFFEGWPDPPSPSTHLEILEGSHHVVLAVDEATGEVVGFANAVSDGVLSAYLPLLEVKPPYRGEGLGHALVEHVLEALDHLYMVDVVCDPDLEGFYASMEFQSLKGMAHRNYDRQSGTPSGE